MGIGTSSVILRNVEESEHALQTREAIDKELRFFRAWTLADVRKALSQFEGFGHIQEQEEEEEAVVVAAPTSVAAVLEAELSWADYYRVLNGTESERRDAEELQERQRWHVVTRGYAMRVDTRAAAELEEYRVGSTQRPPKEDWEKPNHSDDESDSDDDEKSQGSSEAPLATATVDDTADDSEAIVVVPEEEETLMLPAKWDPALSSPMFFGYLRTTVAEVDAERQGEETARVEKESKQERKRREKRWAAVEDFKRALETRLASRLRKIEALDKEHRAALKKREAERDALLEVLEEDEEDGGKEDYLAEYAAEEKAIRAATTAELHRLEEHSSTKETTDRAELVRQEAEARLLDGAETLVAPGGRRLERQARVSLKQCQTDLDGACDELDAAQDALDLEDQGGAAQEEEEDPGGENFIHALKSRLHEAEGKVRLALLALDEGEAVLESAVLRRMREGLLLPLFAPLSQVEATEDRFLTGQPASFDTEESNRTHARLMDVVLGLIVCCTDSLAEKARLMLRLFDFDCDDFLREPEFVVALRVLSRLLCGLGYTTRPIGDADLISMVARALIEGVVVVNAGESASTGVSSVRTTSLLKPPSRESKSSVRGLTLREAEEWLIQTVASSTYLADLFGVGFAFGELSSFVRRRMPVVRLFELGLLRPADLKYHFSRASSVCRLELQTDSKARLHEKALARGADDPLRSDYSRFLPQPKKRSMSKVVPLKHGHLANLSHSRLAAEIKMAEKLQNVWRAKKARVRAEAAARLVAFEEAQKLALQEAREKITLEFEEKEALTGMAKRKWDAKVRMTQAKKRSQKVALDRDATVRLMMQEASDVAAGEVEARFEEIRQARFESMVKAAERPIDATYPPPTDATTSLTNTIQSLNDDDAIQTPRTKKQEDQIVVANAAHVMDEVEISSLRVHCMALGAFPRSLYRTGEAEHERSLRLLLAQPSTPERTLELRLRALNDACTQMKTADLLLELPSKRILLQFVESALGRDGAAPRDAVPQPFDGLTVEDTSSLPKKKKRKRRKKKRKKKQEEEEEEEEESEKKRKDKQLLLLKEEADVGDGMSAAFPGLELPDLALAIEAKKPAALEVKLKDHFRLRNEEELAQSLRQWLCSDFEFGMVTSCVIKRLAEMDAWPIQRSRRAEERRIETTRLEVDRKAKSAIATSRGSIKTVAVSEEVRMKAEMREQSRVMMHTLDAELAKQSRLAEEATAAIEKQANKLRISRLSIKEIEKRKEAVERCVRRAKGGQQMDLTTRFRPADRQQWTQRYMAAMSKKEAVEEVIKEKRLTFEEPWSPSSPEELARLREMVNVVEEFVMLAERGAMTIIQERHLSAEEKTVKPSRTRMADGDAEKRGLLLGLSERWYEANNICFKVATDDDGLFNGSDECAAKAAGHARKGAREYLRLALDHPGILVPLTCTVDYFGFRVLCSAKLPLLKLRFGENGEVRREDLKGDLVHGTIDRGLTVVNSSRALDTALSEMAATLNLARHSIKGKKDLNKKITSANADLRAYKIDNDEEQSMFALTNLWRSLPAESPEDTPHLQLEPRGSSIFWRMLRPEFFRSCPEPLSADANCEITEGVNDADLFIERSREATKVLIGERVNLVADALAERQKAAGTVGGDEELEETEECCLYDANAAREEGLGGPEDAPLGAMRGLGVDVTSELHQRGVNMRHLGLVRARFWKRLSGRASADFGSKILRTKTDFRLEVRRGDQLRIRGRKFRISMTGDFDALNCPLDADYDGLSCAEIAIFSGEVRDSRNSAAMRLAMLCELVARAVKNLLRLKLRRSTSVAGCVCESLAPQLAVDYLNTFTGSAITADATWREEIVPAIHQRFGDRAVDEVEAKSLGKSLEQCAPFLVRRFAAMAGCVLAQRALTAMDAAPMGFEFCVEDLCGASAHSLGGSLCSVGNTFSGRYAALAPIVKHGAPFLDAARAVLLASRAMDLRKNKGYSSLVCKHAPPLYMPLDERRNARVARNRGDLGKIMDGPFPKACIPGVPFTFLSKGSTTLMSLQEEVRALGRLSAAARCARFLGSSDTKEENTVINSSVVLSYHARCSSVDLDEPFAMEAWCLVSKGSGGTPRCVMMSGRCGLSVLHDDHWCFVVFEGEIEVSLTSRTRALEERWTHLCGTYDGTIMRFYVDARLVAEEELRPLVRSSLQAAEKARSSALEEISKSERSARDDCKAMTEKQAFVYLKTKDGEARILKQAMKLVEQADFKLAMDLNAEAKGLKKLNKDEAVKKATVAYKQEVYMKNVQHLAAQYRRLRDEVAEMSRKTREAGQERSRRPCVLGATTPSGRARDGRHPFRGELAHLAVYDSLLTSDDVARHHRGGMRGGSESLDNSTARERDAVRLFGLAAENFLAAVQSGDGELVREHYAAALCGQLALDDADVARSQAPSGAGYSLGAAQRRSVALLERSLRSLEAHGCADTIAAVLAKLPDGPLHAYRAVDVLEALLRVDPAYFENMDTSHARLPIRELARVPQRFGWTSNPTDDKRLYVAAARVHRIVLTELSLADVYGQVDLSWAVALKSDRVLNSLVDAAHRGDDPRVLAIGEGACRDDDLKVIANFRRLAVSLDLTGSSSLLSDVGVSYACKACSSVQSVTLDGCRSLGDATLATMAAHLGQLTLLSVQGLPLISDEGLQPVIVAARGRLRALNVSYCGGVGDETLRTLSQHSAHLELLHAAFCTQLSDHGLYDFAVKSKAASEHLRSLDLSFCPGLGDDGVSCVAERCLKLQYLNLAGVTKITNASARLVTHNLWKLQSLNFDDLALITDDVFFFDKIRDGRSIAQANMLTSLTELHIGDCSRITDRGVGGVSTRCPKLTKLHLLGVSTMTDVGALSIVSEPTQHLQRGSYLKSLDLTRCFHLTDSAVKMLAETCRDLDSFKANGCPLLTDASVASLTKNCDQIRTLGLSRCRRITDASMCQIADHLWLDHLEVANLPRLTDAGLEVLVLEQQGLLRLDISGSHCLTDHALDVLRYHALALVQLTVLNNTTFAPNKLDLLAQSRKGTLRVLRTVDDVQTAEAPPWSGVSGDDQGGGG